jgi:hypothetical protein
MAQQCVVDDTRRWLERAVIGLNLCPFAKAVHAKGQIHYAVSQAREPGALLQDLQREMADLIALPSTQRDTTLLVVPECLEDFVEFNIFLAEAERLLARLGLEGAVQLASFHPSYQFADAAPGDITNFTNRSPYPTLHLLREESIDRAVQAFPQAETIYEANMDTLRRIGAEGWIALGVGPS